MHFSLCVWLFLNMHKLFYDNILYLVVYNTLLAQNSPIFAYDIFALKKIHSAQNFGLYRYWVLVLVHYYFDGRHDKLYTIMKFVMYNHNIQIPKKNSYRSWVEKFWCTIFHAMCVTASQISHVLRSLHKLTKNL